MRVEANEEVSEWNEVRLADVELVVHVFGKKLFERVAHTDDLRICTHTRLIIAPMGGSGQRMGNETRG